MSKPTMDSDWSVEQAANATTQFAPEDVADLMAADIPEPVAIVEGLIFEKTATLIAGRPKGGKSFMSIPLAISLATGKPFLSHFKVCGTKRVLIIAEEDGRERIRKRFLEVAEMMGVNPEDLRDMVKVISRKRLKLDNADKVRDLLKAVDDFQPEIIFLDTLSRMHSRNEDSASDMQPVLDALDDLREKFQCCLIVIHHVNKSRDTGGSLFEKIRGSGAITANMDTLILFSRAKSDKGKVPIRTEILVESKDGDPFSFTLVYDKPSDQVLLAVDDDPLSLDERKAARVEGTFETFMKLYQDNPKGISYKEMMKALDVVRKTATDRLEELEKAGRILHIPNTDRPKRFKPAKIGTF